MTATATSKKGTAMNRKRKLGFIFVSAAFIVLTAAADVLAIVGRPATPVSYAGVARRTVRRSGY
jgi:hypothetical protein